MAFTKEKEGGKTGFGLATPKKLKVCFLLEAGKKDRDVDLSPFLAKNITRERLPFFTPRVTKKKKRMMFMMKKKKEHRKTARSLVLLSLLRAASGWQ